MVETTGLIQKGEYADAIYFGGDILTMESDTPVYAEALAVKDGKILSVGTMAETEKFKDENTRLINLEGKTLLPGFVDGHSHIFLYVANIDSAQLTSPPMGTVKNISDIIAALQEKKKQLQLTGTDWLMGWGYDPDLLKEHRHPTAQDLDEAFPTNPVLLLHVSNHMAVANSAAMKTKNITAQTKDPHGGRIVRKPGSMEPEGLFQEAAMLTFFLDQLDKKEPVEVGAQKLQKALMYYASNGVTTVQEGAMQEREMAIAEYAASHGQLFLDVAGLIFVPVAEKLSGHPLSWGVYRNGLKYAGVKIVMDGSPQGKTAFLKEPYLTPVPGCNHDCCGTPTLNQDEVNAIFLKYYRDNVQVYSHCNGDASIDMMITAHEYAVKQLPNPDVDRRTVIVHSQVMRPEQLDAYKRYGLFASFFTNHTYYWGDVHLQNLGEKRASFISPMHSAIAKGIHVANHTDYNVTPMNQMFVCWTAVNRLTRTNKILGPHERITPYQALQAVTIGGAYMYFEENRKGSLKAGKVADLVILDKNPLKVDPAVIKDVKVLVTVKSGKEVYRWQ